MGWDISKIFASQSVHSLIETANLSLQIVSYAKDFNSLPVCSADFPIWLSSFQHCSEEELSPSDSNGEVSKD